MCAASQYQSGLRRRGGASTLEERQPLRLDNSSDHDGDATDDDDDDTLRANKGRAALTDAECLAEHGKMMALVQVWPSSSVARPLAR